MNQPIEPIAIFEKKFSCSGGEGPLGHPQVYLTFAKTGEIDCPYCGRHFLFVPSPKAASHSTIADGVQVIGEMH